MSNFGGKSSEFEKDYNKRFSSLNKSLKRVQNQLLNVIIQAGTGIKNTNKYWDDVRADIDKQYEEMVRIFDNWAVTEIPLRYRKSIREIGNKINSVKYINEQAEKSTSELIDTYRSSKIMNKLYKNATTDFQNATKRGKKKLYKWTKITQQQLLSDSFMEAEIFNIYTSTGNLTSAARELGSDLFKRASIDATGERYVQTKSKKGTRNYKPNYYAEMVTRTKFHEAHSDAVFAQASNYDTDLVIVSTHNTETVICQEYEGKIFSISGKDRQFPKLTAVPPYHPNCLHLIFPTFKSALRQQGSLEGFSEFSKGKTNKPPYPAGFEPVSERGA